MNPFDKMAKTTTNLPPADQLAEIRAMIKDLKVEEGLIADAIKASGGDKGAFYEAVVQTSTSKRIDTKKVRDLLGDAVHACETDVTATKVVLKKIEGEE